MKLLATLLILLLLPLTILPASKEEVKKLKAVKLSQSINFDGKLTESVYNQNNPLKEFIQRDPDEGKPSTELTNVWVTYDEANIYVSARLFDSDPSSIDKSLARRDSWIDSDWFFFYVDPYLDKKTGYFFAVNPGGSLLDGTFFNDSWNDDSWDGIWEAKSSVDEEGWCVEMKIPFSQLRFKEADEMKWGVNFKREIKRRNEASYFIMVPKKESGFVSHFAELEGLDGIKPRQRFEVLPYVVQKAQYLRHDNSDPFYKGNQYKTSLGADLKIGLGTNLNVDATINPDFGQVELDPAVVNLSAFETHFSEKRPFFIEGRTLFWFGYGGANNNWSFNFGNPTLFYSRRIGRSPQGSVSDNDYADYPNETKILGAAKLTGKIDEAWSVGALSAVTERTYATLFLNDESFKEEVEPFTHYGVFRTQKEFNGGKQGLGMIITSVNRDLRTESLTDRLSRQAYTFGVDGWTFLDEDETYVINGSMVGSYTSGTEEYLQNLQQRSYRYFQRPDATFSNYDPTRKSLSGFYGRMMLNKQKGNFYVNSSLGIVSPGFEYNDLGFQWWSDKINGHIVLGYSWYEPDNIFRRKWVRAAHFRDYDFEGNNLNNGVMVFSGFQFLNYYGFDFNASYNFEDYTKTLTRGGPIAKDPSEYSFSLSGYSDSREKIVVYANTSYWKEAVGSYGTRVGFEIEWKPNSQINFSIGPSYAKTFQKRQYVDTFDDPLAVNTYNTRYIFGELNQETVSASIRLNWTFTPTLSLQLFVQPLFAVGSYNNFKELSQPRSLEYTTYENVSYNSDEEVYIVDPDGNGEAEAFELEDPNFNFKSLRGNLVLRYEVTPGSILYLVWSHDKINFQDAGQFNLARDFKNLWSSEANNVFLVKFSYWLDI